MRIMSPIRKEYQCCVTTGVEPSPRNNVLLSWVWLKTKHCILVCLCLHLMKMLILEWSKYSIINENISSKFFIFRIILNKKIYQWYFSFSSEFLLSKIHYSNSTTIHYSNYSLSLTDLQLFVGRTFL